MKFRTSDGYNLELIDGEWTDGDLSFENKDGVPVDDCGEPLEGEIVSEFPKRFRCDQCEASMINGVFCHERGCPNQGKVYEDGEWVKYHECIYCGCDVRLGDNCDCQDLDDDESDDRNYMESIWQTR